MDTGLTVPQTTQRTDGLCKDLPRTSLCSHLPTPLERAPRLSAALGGPEIWFKRDDLTGLALGGNKIRNMEFIFGELLARGCDSVITTAGVQSNMCRATAAAASRLGLKCVLLLRGSGEEEKQGNLLLDELLGAEIKFLSTKDPYDPRTPGRLEDIQTELKDDGRSPYILHLTGETSAIAACAYVDAAEEMAAQFDDLNISPDHLFVTAGSGVTMAGLVLGFKHLGRDLKVVGIMCSNSTRAFLSERITRYANGTAERLGISTRVNESDFRIHDEYVGPGYAQCYPEVVDAMQLVARNEGILLDPVYTGKCMVGLKDRIARGELGDSEQIVFLHTGGAPGIFADAGSLSS
jgi:D-cysteine desulfhydrase family pyridoxal phosphate-dependent enzyme